MPNLSRARSISSSRSTFMGFPQAAQSILYILMGVNPGRVLSSLKITFSVSFSTKKSTLARPLPSTALNTFTAIFLISSSFSFEISAGTTVFESELLYFAS